MTSGIYKWTNKITGNTYIGQSINMEKRMKEFLHFNIPYAGSKINEERKIYNSLKYWIYDVLEECPTNNLNEIEQKYIKQYPNANLLLNMTYNKPSLLKNKKTKYPTLNENNFIQLLNQKLNQFLSNEKLPSNYKKNFADYYLRPPA